MVRAAASIVGTPVEWFGSANVLSRVEGHVHCLSRLNARTARLVWGVPRHAEDVDLTTGARHRSELVDEAFQFGCPQTSRDGHMVLFVGRGPDGGFDIRLSEQANGREARAITPGGEPLWVGTEEFLYTADGSHVGVYSLPSGSFLLLDSPPIGGKYAVTDKAVSPAADRIAIMTLDDRTNTAISIYTGPGFQSRITMALPGGANPQFEADGRSVLLSVPNQSAQSELMSLEMSSRSLRALAKYSSDDLILAIDGGRAGLFVVSRRVFSDAWLLGARPTRLTTDGSTFSAARSTAGELLASRLVTDGQYTIWNASAGVRLTTGPRDVDPSFSPNGKAWAYSDYARRRIVLCDDVKVGANCRSIRDDDLLPARPSFSPDGTRIAYSTQLGTPHAFVVSIPGGKVEASWDTRGQCQLMWSSSDCVWSFESGGGDHLWFERNAHTGQRTGRRFDLSPTVTDPCWPEQGAPFSLPSIRVQQREESQLLRAPRPGAL